MTAMAPMIDRLAARRAEPNLIDELRADASVKVLIVRHGQVPADNGLRFATTTDTAHLDAEWAVLAELADGTVVLLAAIADADDDPAAVGDAPRWAGVRELAPGLSAEHSELLVTAAALGTWLRDSPFCVGCGARTTVQQAGWARSCAQCGREHFPRTDPAVIVAVESADGERLLLGANAQWRGAVYSCFAGFVEAGESLETTVHREILEEAGVRLRDIRYRASQSWPYPRSLMLGFRAIAVDESTARGDGEEILDARWFTHAEIGTALAGEADYRLPGPASIASRLIREWYEERA
ncbi:NAD+ diphosphatase [Microbacterium keratanolyticum]|nr:NAD(+) diphosphatase [Microbacterium keratanolyticum]MBM7469925.1 NAD+ diphosphatase [Microbacterium keratanolyticum]